MHNRGQGSDSGLTLVEMIVVIILIAILLGAAVAGFNVQRSAAADRSIKTDLLTWSNGADRHYRAMFYYPTTRSGFAQSGQEPTVGEGNQGVGFVVRSGPRAGYVLFAKNAMTSKVFAYSSFDTDAGVVRTDLTDLPTTPPSDGFGLPEGLDDTDWQDPISFG